VSLPDEWRVAYYDRDIERPPAPDIAPLWLRFGARLIDNIVAGLCGGAVGAAVAIVLFASTGSFTLATLIVAIIIAIIGAFLYEMLTGASGGGVGKRIAHIRVQSVSIQARPGLRRGFIRALVPALFAGMPVVGTILVLFDNVPAIWDDEHRTWHDRFAGTIVVSV
jgi:uncharacterized RDD family membrane protein YckC